MAMSTAATSVSLMLWMGHLDFSTFAWVDWATAGAAAGGWCAGMGTPAAASDAKGQPPAFFASPDAALPSADEGSAFAAAAAAAT